METVLLSLEIYYMAFIIAMVMAAVIKILLIVIRRFSGNGKQAESAEGASVNAASSAAAAGSAGGASASGTAGSASATAGNPVGNAAESASASATKQEGGVSA